MIPRYIEIDEPRNVELCTVGQRLRKAVRRRFSHQIGLRAEMFVKAPMSEARSRHEIRHSHAVKASLAKQDRGRLDYVLPICLCLGLAHPHFHYLVAARKSCSHDT
ncbi:hypothetical protein D9M68_949500 [compost metagenome]